MDGHTRKFTLEETRSPKGSIVYAKGRAGLWPFRRAVSYHIGVNCDSICIMDDLLQIQRRGRTVATAERLGASSPLSRLMRAVCEALLHPRHASKSASAHRGGEAATVQWEQLLQPRDRNKR